MINYFLTIDTTTALNYSETNRFVRLKQCIEMWEECVFVALLCFV